jgi:hypothetical protein
MKHILVMQDDGTYPLESSLEDCWEDAFYTWQLDDDSPYERPVVTWEYKDVHTFLVAEWAYTMTGGKDV